MSREDTLDASGPPRAASPIASLSSTFPALSPHQSSPFDAPGRGPAGDADERPPVTFPLVSRDRHLATLTASLRLVWEYRSPRSVLVVGPAGMGKTRLVDAFLEQSLQMNIPIERLHIRPNEQYRGGKGSLPQRLIASVFRLPIEQSDDECLEQLQAEIGFFFLGAEAQAFTRLFARTLGLFGDALPDDEVGQLLDRFATVLRHIAADKLLLFWFDDLDDVQDDGRYWSIELLKRFKDLPILALFATRILPAQLTGALSDIGYAPQPITLNPLSSKEMAAFAERLLAPLSAPSAALVRWVVDEAGGIPAAAVSALQSLFQRGYLLERPDGAWQLNAEETDEAPPPLNPKTTVQEAPLLLLKERWLDLDEQSQYVLRVAALLGDAFAFKDVLALLRLSPLPDEVPWFDDPRPAWLRQLTRELTTLGLLQRVEVEQPDERVLWTLSAPDLAEIVLEGIDDALSRSLSGCIAHLFERRGEPAVKVAAHLEAAQQTKRAARMWLRAADEATAAFENEAAGERYARALRHLGPEDGADYLKALASCGRLRMRLGEFEDAHRVFLLQRQIAYAYDDTLSAIDAFIMLGQSGFERGHYQAARQDLENGLDLAERLDASDPTLVADCLDALVPIILKRGEARAYADSIKLSERALKLRPQSSARVQSLFVLAQVCLGRGDLNRALTSLQEASGLTEWQSEDLPLRSRLQGSLGYVQLILGRPDLAEPHLKSALALAERVGDESLRVAALNNLGEWSIEQDALDEALERLYATQTDAPSRPDAEAVTTRLLSRAYAHQGDLEKAIEHARRALELAQAGESRLLHGVALRNLSEVEGKLIQARWPSAPDPVTVRDRFFDALYILEEMGHWHETSRCLRGYSAFLNSHAMVMDAQRYLRRAEKLAPFSQSQRLL